jgi:putative hydrolase of the HAD superfamily
VVISAVLFDLDDTLFEQRRWLNRAWRIVALEGARHGVDAPPMREALREVCAEGSDRGAIIDRALARVGADHVPVAPLVDAFRSYRTRSIDPYPGTREALAGLRRKVPIALVTDGDPAIQQAKLEALGLDDAFDAVVISDELGRSRRKPDPAPFLAALDRLGVPADAAVHVGDRPDKDVAGAQAAGVRAIRVRTGEYCERPDEPPPWWSAPDVLTAIALLEGVSTPPLPRARLTPMKLSSTLSILSTSARPGRWTRGTTGPR